MLGGALFRRVVFGTFGGNPTKRELAVYDLFRKSGFKIQQHRDFRGWLWGHFVLDAGLLSQALRAGGSMKLVMASTSHAGTRFSISASSCLCCRREASI